MRYDRRGSATVVEYAIVIAVVLLAVLGMARYVKGALGGRWRNVADGFSGGMQYEPGQAP